MKKVAGLILGLIPVSVYAECVPVPDCASIGYTETSCDGGSIKCPFDTSKLKCIPCDSSFRFACTGENVTGGIGNVCNGKYVTCSCDEEAGYYFQNGECICDTSCSAGNIYYSDGSCSSCLEENKTAVGIVVKDKELIMSLDTGTTSWSADNQTDLPNIINYEYGSKDDYAGQENTLAIVEYYGTDADVDKFAGIYCYKYAPDGLKNSAGNWYLPAVGELYSYWFKNYNSVENAFNKLAVSIENGYFWTSTEHNLYKACFFNPKTGNATTGYHKHEYFISVTCFLKI